MPYVRTAATLTFGRSAVSPRGSAAYGVHMTRAITALVVLALALPALAHAQAPQTNAPPGNSAVDEYLETVPGASGDARPRPPAQDGDAACSRPPSAPGWNASAPTEGRSPTPSRRRPDHKCAAYSRPSALGERRPLARPRAARRGRRQRRRQRDGARRCPRSSSRRCWPRSRSSCCDAAPRPERAHGRAHPRRPPAPPSPRCSSRLGLAPAAPAAAPLHIGFLDGVYAADPTERDPWLDRPSP